MYIDKSIEFIETSEGKFVKRNILEVLYKLFCYGRNVRKW